MRRTVFVLLSLLAFSSCITTNTLYSWNNYEKASYKYLKNPNEETVKELLDCYQKIISNQTGTRKVVPPGIYADYGFLLIQQNRKSEGKAMLLKEVELYPESKVFVDRILNLIEE